MATAAAAGSDHDDSSDAECTICRDLFTSPKLLPCSHTFCRRCLLSWLVVPDPRKPLSCPLCRQVIASPPTCASRACDSSATTTNNNNTSSISSIRRKVEEAVDSLPDDLAMAALADSTKLLRKKQSCVGCVVNAAVSVCLDCENQDLLCRHCATVHTNVSATRLHRVEYLADLTPEKLASGLRAFCCGDGHVDVKPAEFFCPSHNAVLCPSCVSYKHSACPEVLSFERRVAELRDEAADMTRKLQSTETALLEVVKKLDLKLDEAEIRSQPVLEDIDAGFDRLERQVRECRRRVKQRVMDRAAEVKGKVQPVKDDFVARLGSLTTHRASAERVQRAMPAKFLNDVNPTLKAKMKQLDLTVDIPPEVECISMPLFLLDQVDLEGIEIGLKHLDLVEAAEHSSSSASNASTQQSDVPFSASSCAQRSGGSALDSEHMTERPGVISAPSVRVTDQPEVSVSAPSVSRIDRLDALVSVPSAPVIDQSNVSTDTQGPAAWNILPAEPLLEKSLTWRFHANTGGRVSLSLNGRTAKWRGKGIGQGIVVSSEPMKVNQLYEVRVDRMEGAGGISLPCGALLLSPDYQTLPNSAMFRWHHAVVFSNDVYERGRQVTNTALKYQLSYLTVNSKVGLMLDSDAGLSLFVDGTCITTVRNVRSPCFALFQLWGNCKRISTLPLRDLS